ncbi:MAG: addiction module protein [Chthoniobacteraceae bacterium]
MAATLENVAHDALELPREKRAELACMLLKSIEETPDAESDEAWEAEIRARIARLDSGEASTVPAAKVFSKLREIARE